MKHRNSEEMFKRLREDLSKMDDETFFSYLGTSLAELKLKQTNNKQH